MFGRTVTIDGREVFVLCSPDTPLSEVLLRASRKLARPLLSIAYGVGESVYSKGRCCLFRGYEYLGDYETEESAKAAAQADYEQRIRSALIATPRPLPSVDDVAETIWRAEYLRATGRDRPLPWAEAISEGDRNRYRFVATAILTLLGGSAR